LFNEKGHGDQQVNDRQPDLRHDELGAQRSPNARSDMHLSMREPSTIMRPPGPPGTPVGGPDNRTTGYVV
jgi:hypothetical protein